MVDNSFNLVDEKWIPVSGANMVSLKEIFEEDRPFSIIRNPVEKISILKLLFAIAQAAWTPNTEQEKIQGGTSVLRERVIEYLENQKDKFWLYGENPFLQYKEVAKGKSLPYNSGFPVILGENTTVLNSDQLSRSLSESEKIIFLLTQLGFALSGKKGDSNIILSPNYKKGKSASSGVSLGFCGYLHSFILANTILESVWLNLISKEHLKTKLSYLKEGVGVPPWEQLPKGENDSIAQKLSLSLMGRLLPMNRFIFLEKDKFYITEGIVGYSLKDDHFHDLSITVIQDKKELKALWVDPNKKPFRVLPSMLVISQNANSNSYNLGIDLAILSAKNICYCKSLVIWSGGIRVSSNAGEQKVSKNDDFLESSVTVSLDFFNDSCIEKYKEILLFFENVSKSLYSSASGYLKEQSIDNKNILFQIMDIFWFKVELLVPEVISICENQDKSKEEVLRKKIWALAHECYDNACSRSTARQIVAWANNKLTQKREGKI